MKGFFNMVYSRRGFIRLIGRLGFAGGLLTVPGIFGAMEAPSMISSAYGFDLGSNFEAGVSYFGGRDPKHVIKDMKDIVDHGCTFVVHTFSEVDYHFYTGAMARARELSLRDLPDGRVDLVIISPNDPEAMVKYVAECQELGLPYLYDPSQQIVRLSGEDLTAGLNGATMLVVNEYEFEMLREKTGLSTSDIRAAPSSACVVTRGAEGSQIWSHDRTYQIPVATPGCAGDPTGVGDAYRAGLVKGLALDLPWDLAGRIGSVAASYALEQPGPQGHRYSLTGFLTRYQAQFGENPELVASFRA